MQEIATTISTIISSVGFPIAAFLLMFWFCKDQLSLVNETMKKNTEAITTLTTYIMVKDGGEKDGK